MTEADRLRLLQIRDAQRHAGGHGPRLDREGGRAVLPRLQETTRVDYAQKSGRDE